MQASLAQQSLTGDYKALVVVFLYGGNDSNNLIIPTADHTERTLYDQARSGLAIPTSELQPLVDAQNQTLEYGVPAEATELAGMFNNRDLSFVCNVGTLVEPIIDRNAYFDETIRKPTALFSHNDQVYQWQTSLPESRVYKSGGWGAKVADLLNGAYNPLDSQVSMSISMKGVTRFLMGNQSSLIPISMGANTPTAYDATLGRDYNNSYNFETDKYRINNAGKRMEVLDKLLRHSYDHLLENSHNRIALRARKIELTLNEATASVETSIDYDTIFADTAELGEQLKTISKLIAAKNTLSNRRQIFFCQLNGFDNHSDQLQDHGDLMQELSKSMAAFNTAMHELGEHDNVLTITQSDFNRTLVSNGAGSDHAWGGHQVVMGGPVDGGKLFGTYPSLDTQGSQSAEDSRGRWIPSISVDQYSAVAANWLGVDANGLDTVFPYLSRFENPLTAVPYVT